MQPRRFAVLAALFLTLALAGRVLAEARKSDPGPHPLKLLKVVINNNGAGEMNDCKGDMTLWVQNTSDVDVDKVRVDVEFYSDTGRMVDKKSKEIANFEPGSKKYVELRWDILGITSVKKFKVWIYYNGGLADRLTQFEAEPPVW